MKRHSLSARWLSLMVVAVLLFSSTGSALSMVLAVTFSGNVLYYPPNGTPSGQAGVSIQVFANIEDGSSVLLGTTQTGRSAGEWTYTGTPPAGATGYKIVKIDPRGLMPSSASAPAGSVVKDVNTVVVQTGTGDISFIVKDPQLGLPKVHDRYLIVTSAKVIPYLADFVNYKRGLGFDMIVMPVEEISNDLTIGNTLRHAIRNTIKQLWSEPDGLKYVMLIGTNKVIPFMTYNPGGMDLVRSTFPAGCTDPNGANIPFAANNCGWAGDWFYTDLNSDWDSNGDGVMGEAFWANPYDPDLVQYKQNHPGWSPDESPAFHPDVYLGRLMMDTGYEVEETLRTIMRFESDGGAWKENTLLAGAMMNYNGVYYDTAKEMYKSLGAKEDTALLNELLWQDILSPAGMSRLTTYEKAHPANIANPPNDYAVDGALTRQNMIQLWNSRDLGFVNASGHGNDGGIYRMWWNMDDVTYGRVENPNSDLAHELGEEIYLSSWDVSALKTPNDSAPVLITLACSTGSWTEPNNFGTYLLKTGRISAWTGETSTGVVSLGWNEPSDGRGQTMTYEIVKELFTNGLPLGDAVWKGLENYYLDSYGSIWSYKSWDWGFINWDLFGDPSMRYWGAGAENSAYWPMYHADWPGSGATPLVGPGLFSGVKWSKAIGALDGMTQNASPVIGADGTVYMGDGSGQVRAFSAKGTLLWTFPGNSPIYTTPAIGKDGRIYIKTIDSMIALNPDGSLFWEDAVGAGSGSPKFGRNGLVYVGGSSPGNNHYLASYSPAGAGTVVTAVDSEITSAISVAKNGSILFGTKNGTLYRVRDNFTVLSMALTPGGSIGHGMALREDNDPLAFIPTSKGELFAMALQEYNIVQRWKWTNPSGASAIWGAPAYGENQPGQGRVFFGSQDGKVRALNAVDGSLVWETSVGGPVASAPALDPTRVYVMVDSPSSLFILNRADGSIEKSLVFDGMAVGESPAIGPSTTVYAGVAQSGGAYLKAFAPANWLVEPEINYAIPDYQSIILGFTKDPVNYIRVEARDPGGTWAAVDSLAPGQETLTIDMVFSKKEIRAITVAPQLASMAQLMEVEDSDYTPVLTVTPLPGPPAAPTGLAVQALSSSQLKLTWNEPAAGSDPADGRLVLRKAPGETVFTPLIQLPANIQAWVDQGLQPASLYAYQLRSFNSGGESPVSIAAQATTLAETLPPPSAVTVTPLSDTTFRICWIPGGESLKTIIGRQPFGQSSPDILKTVSERITCYDDTAAYSFQFTYWLKHINSTGTLESPWVLSDPVRAATYLVTYSSYLPLLTR